MLFYERSWQSEFNTHFLPIGEGLLATITGIADFMPKRSIVAKESHWVVKVDKCTGGEHVFRITQRK